MGKVTTFRDSDPGFLTVPSPATGTVSRIQYCLPTPCLALLATQGLPRETQRTRPGAGTSEAHRDAAGAVACS